MCGEDLCGVVRSCVVCLYGWLMCSALFLLCSVNHRLSHLEDDICDLTLDQDK